MRDAGSNARRVLAAVAVGGSVVVIALTVLTARAVQLSSRLSAPTDVASAWAGDHGERVADAWRGTRAAARPAISAASPVVIARPVVSVANAESPTGKIDVIVAAETAAVADIGPAIRSRERPRAA
jgi:hypothetical protein